MKRKLTVCPQSKTFAGAVFFMHTQNVLVIPEIHKEIKKELLVIPEIHKEIKNVGGGARIVTLTGWTHRLHTNTKRKCVSILHIPELR